MNTEGKWLPNEISTASERHRDWRGRTVLLKEIDEEIYTDQEDIQICQSGAIFNSVNEIEGRGWKIGRQRVPICPNELSFAGDFFFADSDIFDTVIGERCLRTLENDTRFDEQVVLRICRMAASSNTLKKRLKLSFRDNVGSRKKILKIIFFQELGYPIICATNSPRASDKKFTKKREKKFEEAILKLCKSDSNLDESKRDIKTSWWRRTTFKEICADGAEEMEDREMDGVDILFNDEPALLVMEAFSSGIIGTDEKFSIMLLGRLDAWMTAIIEDLPRKKKGTTKGGAETIVLRGRYAELLLKSNIITS